MRIIHLCYRSRQYLKPLVCRQLSLSAACMVEKLPSLMEFPIIGTPKFSHTIRNWFISRTLITPYFDNEFSIKEFSQGAKYAASTVSSNLAEGNFEDMKNYLTQDCLATLEKNLSLFDNEQRSTLAIDIKDVYFSFVYQIGILMEDHPTEENKSIRHVEITCVCH